MKITPISGDMAIKLAIGAGVAVAVWMLYQKARQAAGYISDQTEHVVDMAIEQADKVNPLNNDNVIYRGVNVITGGDDENTLGGRIYDLFHPWD